MAKMYAWSTFKAEVNDWGQTTKFIRPGDEVSKSMLKVSDEEWQELIDVGAVREEQYPDIPDDVAPAEAAKLSSTPTEEVSLTEVTEPAKPDK